MRLGVRHALVGDVLVPGDVRVEDGRVAAVGVHPRGERGLAAPGFVDLQVNGFAGVDFASAAPGDYATAGAALARTGVTTFLPTFISASEEDLARALGVLAAVAEASAGARRGQPAGARRALPAGARPTSPARASAAGPRIPGAHLEGPFLSPRWPGAHDPSLLRAPDPGLVERLPGPIAMVTLAPELPGALRLVQRLTARGVVVSAGHSDADAAAARAGFDAGIRAITHLHNAHRRVAHRDPGLGGVALVRPDVTVQVILDGVHLADEIALAALRAAGDRLSLVTDAMAAAGLGPGRYRLGARDVLVEGAEARLPDGTLAGSVLTLDAAVRNLVALGASETTALLAATRAPARLLARADVGALAAGIPADVVVLDDRLEVRRTLVGGRVAHAA